MYENFGKLLFKVLSVGVILVGFIGIISNYYFQKLSIQYNTQNSINNYHTRFTSYINEEASMLESFLNLIKEKQKLQKLFISSNKSQLFNSSKELYNFLNKNNNITHFYFIKPDGKVLLRVHDFKRDSDIIKRYTFLKAKETQNIFHGIEFGLKKNYTLRVVSPWVVNGELIGYIELGKEIDKISETISNELGMEIFYAVDKSEYHNSAQFILDRIKNNLKTKDHLIVYETIPANDQIVNFIETYKRPKWLHIDDKSYIGYTTPLEDISKKKLGLKLFLVDISKEYNELIHSVLYYTLIMVSVIIFILIIEYIIARKKQEELDEALLEIKRRTKEKENLLSLFDKGDSVLFRWKNDEKLSIDYVSSNVEKLFGYTKDDFLNSSISYMECIYHSDIDRVREEVIKGKKSLSGFFKHNPYRIITKQGEIKWILDYTVLDKNENGKTTNLLGYTVDITDQIEKDKILLEQRKLASLGEMIGNIAHQWRQPLTAISSLSSGLTLQKELGVLNDQFLEESLKKITKTSKYLSDVIDTFRKFVKSEKTYYDINILDEINKSIELIETSLDNDIINIINNTKDQDKVVIKLAEGELEEVIINILKNAVDILIEKDIKEPWIKIELETLEKSAVITIEDNAGGIPENIISKIFDPYFTTKHQSQGTGLGLYISHKIVCETLKGNLYIKNTDNGAKFYIEIPLEDFTPKV